MPGQFEEIGGVSVGIRGDFSELERDLQSAATLAKSAGANIAGALSTGFDTASQSAYDFTQSARKVIDVQKALDTELIQAKGALIDIKMAYEQGAASADALARAELNLESATKRASIALQEIKPPEDNFKSFAEGVGNFIKNPLQAAGGAATDFITAIGPMGAAVAAGAVAVGLLGKAVVDLVLAEGEAAEKTQNFADRLQLSFQETRKLSEMATIAGVSVGVLERTSQRLASAFEDSDGAGKKVAQALDSVGIAADGTGQTLVKVLEHLASIPDAGERIALAHKIMGRGAIELEPLLKNYAALQKAVESLGGEITDRMVKALTEADDAADKLGLAWDHLKEGLAATFAPAVTAGLDVLTRLLAGPPTAALEERINSLISEINRLKLAADSAGTSMTMMMTGGLSDGSFTNAGRIQQMEAELKKLQELPAAQKEAIARSKEYNEEIDKSNRAAQLYVQGQKERERAASEASYKIARAQYEENQQAVALYKAQQAEVKALSDALKFFHVLQSDPALEQAKLLMAQLNLAYQMGKVSLKDLTAAQADYNKVFGYDFATYAEKALTLIDQMDQKWLKLSQSITAQRELLRSPEFSDRAKGMLEDLNANLPFDPAREARRKGTPLGDALLRGGVDRDSGLPQNIMALNAALQDQQATLQEIESLWGRFSGEVQRLAKTNLPEASEAYRKMIEFATLHGEAIGRVMKLEQERLQLIIREKTLRGESATAEIIQLENLRIKTDILTASSQALGKMYSGVLDSLRTGFNSLTRGIADAIVEGKSLGDVFEAVGKQILKSILDVVINQGLKALGAELLKQTGLVSSLFGGLAKVGGVAGQEALAAKAGSDAVKKIIGSSTDAAGGAASSASGLATGLNIAGLGVQVASGISTGIQLARIESDVAKIEISTRQTITQLIHHQGTFNEWLPKLDYLLDIWKSVDAIKLTIQSDLVPILQHILSDNPNGLGGGFWGTAGGPGARTAEELKASGPFGGANVTPGEPVSAGVPGLVADAAKRFSRGFADLNSSATKIAKASETLAVGFTGPGFPGLGGTTEHAFAPGWELDTGGGIGFVSWLEKQQFTGAEAAVEKLQKAGVTITQIFQWLSKFAKGSDLSSAALGMGGVMAGFGGGGRAVTDLSGFSEAFQSIQRSSFGGTADLGNSSFINPAMMRGGASGVSDSDKSQALAQYSAWIQQFAAERAQQTADALAGMQSLALRQFTKAFESATAGHSIRMDSTGKFMQLDQAGNLIDADTGAMLVNYERLYNQFANPNGVPTGMQGTQDVKRTNGMGGVTTFAANQRAYGAAPVDYGGLLRDYSGRLNTTWQTQSPADFASSMFGAGGSRTIVIQAFDPASRAIGRGLVDELQNNGIYR